MKDAIKQWMAQTPRVRGVLAYGVRFTDKTSINETYSRDFSIVALENTWRCIADAYQVLTLHRFPVARMQWIYENAVLTCVRRNDGIILGLFVTPNGRELDNKELERQLTEFQSIRKSTG